MHWGLLYAILFLSFSFPALGNNHDKEADMLSKVQSGGLLKFNEVKFLENVGQMMDMNGNPIPFVLFKAEAPGMNLWITESGITFQTLKLFKEVVSDGELSDSERKEIELTGKSKTKKYLDWERIDVELKGATIKKENVIKELPLQGHFNYFYPHCPNGIYEVKQYERVTIKNVYPGIDWVFYNSTSKGMKYDFVVNPGAEYKQIELVYKSKTPVTINEQGELQLTTQYGNIKENKPVSFLENKEIETRFKLNRQEEVIVNETKGYMSTVRFELEGILKNNLASSLIIDPQLVWGTFYGGNGLDGPQSSDTDNNDNLYVTGYFSSTNFPVQNQPGSYFQGGTGGGQDIVLVKFNKNGTLLWSTYYGGTQGEAAYSVACDGTGNVYITGDCGSGFPLQNPLGGAYFQGANAGGADAFILKFDNSGQRVWATYYGGSGNEVGNSIVADASGNIFVCGSTTSTNIPIQNLGSGAYFQGTYGGGTEDVFILKFNSGGALLWATYYGGVLEEKAYALTSDLNGNVFVTGYTRSTNLPLHNPGGVFFQGTYGGGNADAFILKFNNLGLPLWATYFGGGDNDFGRSIACDNSGNLFVAGQSAGAGIPLLNPGGGAYFQTYNSWLDVFIGKFNNSGVQLWTTYYGGLYDDYMFSTDNLAVTSCGNMYLGFNTASHSPWPFSPALQSSCDAGGYFDNAYNGGPEDVFLVYLSGSGVLLWSTYIGGDGSDFRTPLALDSENNLLVSGEWTQLTNNSTYPLVNPGSGAFFDSTFNGGLDDAFVMKFLNPAYTLTPVSNTPICLGDSLVLNTNSHACFNSYLWTGPNGFTSIMQSPKILNAQPNMSGWYTITVQTQFCNTYSDSIFVIINSTNIVSGSINICPGQSVLIHGINQSTSGVYTQTFTSVLTGCDSVSSITLNAGNPINTSATQTLCQGQSISIHGISQSTAGIYTQTFAAVGGCDSVSSITLNVNSISTHTINPVSCYSYTLNGQVYTTTGIYSQTLSNVAGCDSILTINFTLNPAINTTGFQTICQGQLVFIHGVAQGTSGIYTQTFTAVGGCDSISSVTLNVNGASTHTINPVSCYSYTLNGQVYTTTGLYTQTLTNGLGCDSLLTINFTKTTAINTSNTKTICSNASTIIHGTPQYTSGIYTQSFVTTSGCDSISSVTLNVIPNPTLSITPPLDTITHGSSITITALGANMYVWSNSSTSSSIIVSPTQNTTYCVVGVNNVICSDTLCSDVIVITNSCDDTKIFVPTGFSPNNDGQNDELRLFSTGTPTKYYFSVYNRWGEIVFETTDISQTWDGTVNNQLMNTAVFYYTLRYTCKSSNSEEVVKGNITLVR